jgi:hypothetical protein
MKSYITTANFFNNLRTYQTQTNSTTYAKEGRLTTPGTVAGVSTVAIVNVKTNVNLVQADCPAGRILRETGRRLYPGQNPGLNVGDKYSGAVVGTTATQTMWVMVYDVMTGISAFINPNDTVFAVYSSDKPLELINPLEGSSFVLGQPVLTGGLATVTSVYNLALATAPLTASAAVTIDPSVAKYQTIYANPASNQVITLNLNTANLVLGQELIVAVFIQNAANIFTTNVTAGTGFQCNATASGNAYSGIANAAAGNGSTNATQTVVLTFVCLDGVKMTLISPPAITHA